MTEFHSLEFHLQVLLLFFSGVQLSCRLLSSYLVRQHLLRHIGQKEEGLDERIEVACISDIFQANWYLVHPLSLIQGKRLSFQTCLNCCNHILIIFRVLRLYLLMTASAGLAILWLHK